MARTSIIICEPIESIGVFDFIGLRVRIRPKSDGRLIALASFEKEVPVAPDGPIATTHGIETARGQPLGCLG